MITYRIVKNLGVEVGRWPKGMRPDDYYDGMYGAPEDLSYSDLVSSDEFDPSTAQEYLDRTDWYIIREVDNATACPTDIKNMRQGARNKL